MREKDKDEPFKIRISIFYKILAPVLVLLLLAIGVGTLITVKLESRAMTGQLVESMEVTTQSIASITRNAFGSLNWAYLEEFLHELRQITPGIVSALVVNPQGTVYMAHDRAVYGDEVDPELLRGEERILENHVLGPDGEVGLLMVHPMRIGQDDWHVLLGVSLAQVHGAVADLIKRSVFWSALIVALATIAVFVMTRAITRPIISLAGSAEQIAKGDLEHEVTVSSPDEVGLLAHEFNRMLSHLREARNDLRTSMIDLETANARLEQETEHARRLAMEAQQASLAKSQFLANMSHEIRTPLNGVVSMLELLRDTRLSSEQGEYIAMAAVSAESLLALINDILDFSRIEAGRMELALRDFDLEMELVRMMAVLSARAKDKQVELLMHYDVQAPRMVRGDNLRLRQVLYNLGWNAIKFTDLGHVFLEAQCLRRKDGVALFRFSVRDTGRGIAPDKMDEIFEHFTQADYSSTRQHGGAGLGLAISRRLVRMMGGEIRVESTPGQGSIFTFDLELALAEQPEVVENAPDLRGLNALVVDDNEINRRILSQYLKNWQVQHDLAEDGETALQYLEIGLIKDRKYHFALIDHAMPGMDGLELATRIRHDPRYSDLPLIALSSHWGQVAADAFYASGFSSYLPKPTARTDLLAGIQAALRGQTESSLTATSRTLPPSPEAQTASCTPPDQPSHWSHLDVLLVEDHPINRKSVLIILKKLGIEAVTACNGEEAVAMIRNQSFDLVLMDCQMPVMDGYEATRLIRKWEEGRRGAEDGERSKEDMEPGISAFQVSGFTPRPSSGRTPIIALTANAMEGDREKCLDAGMDDYLPKPFSREAFVAMIAKYLPARDELDSVTRQGSDAQAQVFNYQGALERYDNDEEITLEMLRDFIQEGAEELDSLVEALERGDPEADGKVHRLKGACSYIGAERMRDNCTRIMESLNGGNWEQARSVLAGLREEWDAFLEATREKVS